MLRLFSRASRRCSAFRLPQVSASQTPFRTFSSEDATNEAFEGQTVPDNRFEGVGQPFDKSISNVLSRTLADSEVVLAKDGTLKVSDEHYKEILNAAFDVGGWALVPCSEMKELDLSEKGDKQFLTMIREYSLYCHGRFVSQAFGETPFYPGKQYYSEATEKIKTNALSRCCKDLGVASELWSKAWTDNWKSRYAVQEWVENTSNGRKANLWRRKDGEWTWPFKKTTFQKSY